ncbi:hypothetical protein [Microvirga zambiensis]|uniref:hypothetical protein n=1 Tax=Microvirga zambiensis TaxID=1402137 RepID=UPI00191FD891|nr:hypothetical protein [Microvirga zambiensis]
MAKKSRVVGDELVLTAKAIRRGEKLERTLTKLTIVQEAGSPAEAFLKAVQRGLAQLRKEDVPANRESAEKKASVEKAEPAPRKAPRTSSSRKTVRKPKAIAEKATEAAAPAAETSKPSTES